MVMKQLPNRNVSGIVGMLRLYCNSVHRGRRVIFTSREKAKSESSGQSSVSLVRDPGDQDLGLVLQPELSESLRMLSLVLGLESRRDDPGDRRRKPLLQEESSHSGIASAPVFRGQGVEFLGRMLSPGEEMGMVTRGRTGAPLQPLQSLRTSEEVSDFDPHCQSPESFQKAPGKGDHLLCLESVCGVQPCPGRVRMLRWEEGLLRRGESLDGIQMSTGTPDGLSLMLGTREGIEMTQGILWMGKIELERGAELGHELCLGDSSPELLCTVRTGRPRNPPVV